MSDYVPFYFTPRFPMLLNILMGRGVRQREPHEIVVIVVPLGRLVEAVASIVFTDGHAYMRETRFYSDLAALDRIDWEILQRSDYRRSDEDPGKMNRYQAEALVHGALRLDGIDGLACYEDGERTRSRGWSTNAAWRSRCSSSRPGTADDPLRRRQPPRCGN